MANSTLTQLIQQRVSVRAFQDKAVSRSDIEELLKVAGQSASGSNLQPWKVHVLTGTHKSSLTQKIHERAATAPMGEGGDIPIYPDNLEAPWKQRRWECGEALYETLNIGRDDKMGRLLQVLKNFEFFGAPVGLIITMDRSLSQAQILDLGLLIQNIQLLAVERGLGTCVQASWTLWPNTIREHLNLDEREMIMSGIALGYPDEQAAVNQLRQPRIDLTDWAAFYGFD